MLNLGRTGCCFSIFLLFFGIGFNHVVAGLAHGSDEPIFVGSARCKRDSGPFAGKVNRGINNAINLFQAALDGVGAVGAGHTK